MRRIDWIGAAGCLVFLAVLAGFWVHSLYRDHQRHEAFVQQVWARVDTECWRYDRYTMRWLNCFDRVQGEIGQEILDGAFPKPEIEYAPEDMEFEGVNR